MSNKWIMVNLSDDLNTLSVKQNDAFLKNDTDRIMVATYKILSAFAEHASSATSNEDVASIRAKIHFALDQFEKQVRS